MIQVNRIYLIFNRTSDQKIFKLDTSVIRIQRNKKETQRHKKQQSYSLSNSVFLYKF